MLRVGLLLGVLGIAYGWCSWGAGQWGFSPLIQLGRTSLLVYWVHIEFVYGRFSILRKYEQSIGMASVGLLTIFLMMLGLSLVRTNWKREGVVRKWLRRRWAVFRTATSGAKAVIKCSGISQR